MLVAGAMLAGQAPPGPDASQGKWVLRFFHDVERSSFQVGDLQFASATHGLAVGVLTTKDKRGSVAALTIDGGKGWDFVKLPDGARTAFFLDPTHAWLVAEDGIFFSSDSRKWERLVKLKNVVRIFFLDAQTGFAAGGPKKVWRTKDGGKTWEEVAEAAEPKADPDRSLYAWIEFARDASNERPRFGLIGGYHQPERAEFSRFPDWMDPERARRRRQLPSLTLLLQTSDGGATWKASSSSIMGRLTRYKVLPDGAALSLVEFQQSFDWPSEVYKIDVIKGTTERTFREKDVAITDMALLPDGTAYLAGYQPAGALARLPVPGKVRIFRSADRKNWSEMEVDYRAVAQRVYLSARPGAGVWAATDTGMVLQLTAR
jgi:hypothetical protein